MDDAPLLLNPGPVPISPAVRDAMTEPMVSHRSESFEKVYDRAQDALLEIFEESSLSGSRTASEGTALVLNGTATMGMEAAIANLVDPSDEVVALVNGKFGRRFARIADRYATVSRVEVPWGASFDLETVREAVTDETAVVTAVHNETSTGLLNPIESIGDIASAHDALFVVDGVTSIGGDVFHIDDWGVDVAVTDAQKCLGAPPGVSALYLAEDVPGQLDGSNAPFYQDLEWHCRKAAESQTPFTSAIPLIRALAVASEETVAEGLPERIGRHRIQARALRRAFEALGLELFPDPTGETTLSNTVTAVSLPSPVRGEWASFAGAVQSRGVSVSGGQGHLSGEILRVSNMGSLDGGDLRRGIQAIGDALVECGATVDTDGALEAMNTELSTEITAESERQ